MTKLKKELKFKNEINWDMPKIQKLFSNFNLFW